MKLIRVIKKFVDDVNHTRKMSEEIKEAIKNQSSMINNKLTELITSVNRLTEIKNNHQELFINNGYQGPPTNRVESALKDHPVMFAYKTYNTSHPEYDANKVRNFPGKIFNLHRDLANPVYSELKKLIKDDEISEAKWADILKETLEEIKTIPHADEVFKRKAFVEEYLQKLEEKYEAYYRPGWVNLDDALFLYWVVRRLQPKTIVQTGVCNGLSSAFMMLALVKNGPDGSLHVIDMPPVFNSNEEVWKVKGRTYGVVIPEGKSSGWLVPDMYRDRFEVLCGDARLLLPGLLKKLGNIDMFYHDSDHTYDHMLFEFQEAKNYLSPSSVIVSDDIAWNASLWDFADEHIVPAYNYRGSMGIVCF